MEGSCYIHDAKQLRWAVIGAEDARIAKDVEMSMLQWRQLSEGGNDVARLQQDLYYDFFKAKHTTQYLEKYTNIHSHAGQTLHDRIKFGINVLSVNKLDGKWVISTKIVEDDTLHTFHASKLMVASGMTSVPNMPVLPGQENFGGPIIHQEAFGSSRILTSPDIKISLC